MAAPLPIGNPAPQDGLIPEQALFEAHNRTLHAYVHIPFCQVICGYCDFNTYTASDLSGAAHSEYADLVIAEIEFSSRVIEKSNLPKRKLKTVFFGGGTPTQLPAKDLVRILSALRNAYDFLPEIEITTEANPDTVDAHYLAELQSGGFNRVSIGMQSAVSSVLATLERTHKPENVSKVVGAAQALGLKTSVDLIYGAPGETLEQWRESVLAAIALQPDHISAYALIVETGTKLARQIKSGEFEDVDEDLQADKFELADTLLKVAGYEWYEVSNWAKAIDGSNFKNSSDHNYSYWLSQDWWGYGPGAHSHIGGVRWWNVKHPTSYSAKILQGVSPAIGRETLSDRTRLEERVLLEIRTTQGLSIEVAKMVSKDATDLIAWFIADGLVEPAAALSGTLKLTLKGRLLADSLVLKLVSD